MQNRLKETKSQERLINLMLQAGVEWPEGAEFAVQGGESGNVHFSRLKPLRSGPKHWTLHGRKNLKGKSWFINEGKPLPNWHQTIITRDQYEARDGWITWHGGERPVDGDVPVMVMLYNGKPGGWASDENGVVKIAHRWMWTNEITAYRIHKEQPEAHDENYDLPAEPCESVKACTHDQPTIEQLIAEWKRLDAVAEKSRVAAEIDRAAFDRAAEAVEEALRKAGWH